MRNRRFIEKSMSNSEPSLIPKAGIKDGSAMQY